MSLSDDQVRRIARLARIDLRAGETEDVAARLNRVLGLIDQMSAVDTAGIEPMAHPLDARLAQGQRLRSDEVTEKDERERYQAVAPEGKDGARAVQDGLYLVPKVIE
jgi:aspartyl-tRNA(Asn)/glutamyl-tRNA(Gln) amidotransferase subunit C